MVYTYSRIARSNKKKQTTDTLNNTDEYQKHYPLRKELDTEEYIWYDSIFMKFQNQQNWSMLIKMSGWGYLCRLVSELIGKGHNRNFWGDGNMLFWWRFGLQGLHICQNSSEDDFFSFHCI